MRNRRFEIFFFFFFSNFNDSRKFEVRTRCIAQVVQRIETTNVISRVPIFFASFLPSLLSADLLPFPSRNSSLFSSFIIIFFFFFLLSPSPPARAMHMIIVVGNRQSIDARRCRPFPSLTGGPPPTCPTVYIPFQFNSYISRHLLARSKFFYLCQ